MALTNGSYNGKGLSLMIASTEYNMDVVSVALTSSDLDNPTFADVTSANRQWTLTATVKFDAATGSLWRYVWENPGTTAVAWIIKAYGNTTASTSQPHFSGTMNVGPKPDFTGDANSEFTTDISFTVIGTPTTVTS